MTASFILRSIDDLSEIVNLPSDYYIFIVFKDSGWIRYYIRPHYFKDHVFLIDNNNNFIDEFLDLKSAVKYCFAQMYYEIYV